MSSKQVFGATPRHIDAGILFESAMRRFSPRTALAWDGGRRSYADLSDRVHRIAATLGRLGVGRGDRVLLMLANGPEFVENWWGAVIAGAVVVPLTSRAVATDLARAVRIAKPRVAVLGAVAGPQHLEALQPARAEGLVLVAEDGARADLAPQQLLDNEALAERPALQLDEPCAMYFTAGSTGEPKGVVRSHQSVVWGLSMLAQRLAADDVLIARAPMGHTGGSLTGPFAVLMAGGTLAIPKGSDAVSILDAVERFGASHVYVHPTAFAKAMLQSLRQKPRALASLHRLQWTAGPLPEPVRNELLQTFPHLPLEVTYGMTEASNLASYAYAAPRAAALKTSNCVGFPLPGGQVRVVDAAGTELGCGQEGEVQVRTATAFDGYWQDAEATARAITPDGWFRTGDIGFLDDEGALHLSGRQREIIKTGGLAVHPTEVEQALAEHASVADVVVFGRPDAEWDEAVVAAVSLHAGTRPGSVTSADLLIHCRNRLPGYKVPKELHMLAEIPRNGSGKPDKRRVAAFLGEMLQAQNSKEQPQP